MPPRVVVYTSKGCRYCKATEARLGALGVRAEYIDVQRLPERRYEMIELANRSTVPQIFVGSYHIGGNAELQSVAGDAGAFMSFLESYGDNDERAPLPLTVDEKGILNTVECTPSIREDYDAVAVAELVAAIAPGDRKQPGRFRKRNRCFLGSEAMNYLLKVKRMRISEAISLCSRAIDKHLFRPLDGDVPHMFHNDGAYRYIAHERFGKGCLNMSVVCNEDITPAHVLSEHLRTLVNDLYDEFLSADGRSVDYDGIGQSPLYHRYVCATQRLQRISLDQLSHNERCAFFLNMYNSLVIHAQIVLGAPRNALQRARFFNRASYVIGGIEYSLNDMEHGVLWCNPKAGLLHKRRFAHNDPRRRIILERLDPRIHFALVCGAKGCPPIRSYASATLDGELQVATEGFLEGGGVEITDTEIRCSKLFYWYVADFGGRDRILPWIIEHMPRKAAFELQTTLSAGQHRIKFQNYDWTINGVRKNNLEDDTSSLEGSDTVSTAPSFAFSTLPATAEGSVVSESADTDDDSSSCSASSETDSSSNANSSFNATGSPTKSYAGPYIFHM